MHILAIGNFYAPEETGIAPYTTGLAEHLAGRGHQVTMVTTMPSYPQWAVYPEYRGVFRRQEWRGGVDVRRTRSYVPRKQSAMHRGIYEASFLFAALTSLTVRRPDIVIGVVPALSAGVAARIVASYFRSPYGLLFQDLTGPAATQSGMIGGGRTAGAISTIEGWTARNAAAIGIIAEGFRPYLHSIGVKPHRIHRVRNWMHLHQSKLSRIETRRLLDLPQDAVICLHAGNMGLKQGLTTIVESARLAVEADPKLKFVLMGDGSQRQTLLELCKRLHLPNVRFLPIQPPELFPSALAAADILLVNQRGSVTNMSLPGKLTSYFAAGRPVIAAVSPDSETATEIRNSGAGILVPPDQPTALLDAIRELTLDTGLQTRVSSNAQAYAITSMSPNQALFELETLLGVISVPPIDTQSVPR